METEMKILKNKGSVYIKTMQYVVLKWTSQCKDDSWFHLNLFIESLPYCQWQNKNS